MHERRIIPLLLWLALLLAWAPDAVASNLQRQFNTAYSEFHALAKDAKRGQFRSHWLDVEKRFLDIYKANTNGSLAPKALYYLGRVHEELGQRSFLAADFETSCDYYQRMATRFPKHPWADDCLYRRAVIQLERLKRPDRAYVDLLNIEHNHKDGDMYDKAVALLRKMDAQNAASAPARAAPAPAAAPAAAASALAPPASSAQAQAAQAQTRSPGQPALLNQVRYHSTDDYTRVVIDMSGEAGFKWQLLEADKKGELPTRLYVDLMNTELSSEAARDQTVKDGILKQIRTGQNTPTSARVVLDFNAFKDYKVFQLHEPFRVVVDVYGPGATQVAAAKPAPAQPAQAAPKAAPGQKSAAQKAAPAKKSEPVKPDAAQRQQASSLIEQLGLTVQTIMIDPGHGGKDVGAAANGLYEKDIVLRAAKIIGAKLEARGFRVLYTRTTDVFIPLEERTAMANVRKADLFLSIHCNAVEDPAANGLEVYSLNLARTQDAVRVAARENAVSAKRISDLQIILTDLMLNSKVKESKDLAGQVQGNILKSVRPKYPLRDRKQREAPFYVLMGAKMPAILIELGYLTNPEEAKRLSNQEYLARMADGIVNGVVAYKTTIERYASR